MWDMLLTNWGPEPMDRGEIEREEATEIPPPAHPRQRTRTPAIRRSSKAGAGGGTQPKGPQSYYTQCTIRSLFSKGAYRKRWRD